MAAIQPSVKCTCKHRQFVSHILSVSNKYMLPPSACLPYLYLSYNTKCCSQPAAILYQLQLQLLWLTPTVVTISVHISVSSDIHTYCMLLCTDVTFWMLQQHGRIFELTGCCQTSLTWLKTNWMWNLSMNLCMCVLIYVSALYKHMSCCITKVVNWHN
jgi:hypothetical protein